MIDIHRRCRAMHGQALTEALVAMVPLAALFLLVPVLGRQLDTAGAAQRLATGAAFDVARGRPDPAGTGVTTLLDPADDSAAWRVGGLHPAAMDLRREWRFDQGFTRVDARLRAAQPHALARWTASTTRHAVILGGAGHAPGDLDAQARLGESAHAWSDAASRSARAGHAAASALQPVDAAWRRAAPDFDWLSPWAGLVPAQASRP